MHHVTGCEIGLLPIGGSAFNDDGNGVIHLTGARISAQLAKGQVHRGGVGVTIGKSGQAAKRAGRILPVGIGPQVLMAINGIK